MWGLKPPPSSKHQPQPLIALRNQQLQLHYSLDRNCFYALKAFNSVNILYSVNI